MLKTLYQTILTHLKEEFAEFAIPDSNFSLSPFGGSFPYFTITGKTFNLKRTLLKKKGGEKKLSFVEEFTVPTERAEKKGPYNQRAPILEIESVVVIKKPGTPQEEVQNLDSSQYGINDKEIILSDEYAGGTKLVVSYKSLGEEFSDRFDLKFELKIYEQDPVVLEQYSLLSISAIWGNMQNLVDQTYQYATGNIMADINIGELAFNGQTTDLSDKSISNLNFTITGIASFVITKTDGYHVIDQVKLGEHEGIVHNKDGLSVGYSK